MFAGIVWPEPESGDGEYDIGRWVISYPGGSIFCMGSARRVKSWSKSWVFRSMSSKNGGNVRISSLYLSTVRIYIAHYKEGVYTNIVLEFGDNTESPKANSPKLVLKPSNQVSNVWAFFSDIVDFPLLPICSVTAADASSYRSTQFSPYGEARIGCPREIALFPFQFLLPADSGITASFKSSTIKSSSTHFALFSVLRCGGVELNGS